MNNPIVTVKRYPGNWSTITEKRVKLSEACIWFTKHGYTAFRAYTVDCKRCVQYRKPACKTEYSMIIDLNDLQRRV